MSIMMITTRDIWTMCVGAAGWTVAIPAVRMAGRAVAADKGASLSSRKAAALAVGVVIAASTTPLLSALLGWQTNHEKVRGVALALGTAQVIDGLVHLLWPAFYDTNPDTGLACAGNIFYGAGLLGLFSAFA